VLRTTNPILLAYKYVHADPPHRLALTVTRHRVVEVQEAAIDQASYSTLFTRDGLAVTTAVFEVRNSRQQFLRVRLPRASKVWSVFVDGRPEKPAMSEDGDTVLIKIITSSRGFPVRLVYATEGPRIGGLGSVRATLARPGILATRTRWDVYLPEGVAYRQPRSNMQLAEAGAFHGLEQPLTAGADEAVRRAVEPLHINVPTSGVHFAFDKLYANQGDEEAWLAIAYASGAGAAAGRMASLAGTAALWLGLALAVTGSARIGRRLALVMAALGGTILGVTVGLYRLSPLPPLVLTVLLAVALAAYHGWRRRRSEPAVAPADA
jgi:hypothetical protein